MAYLTPNLSQYFICYASLLSYSATGKILGLKNKTIKSSTPDISPSANCLIAPALHGAQHDIKTSFIYLYSIPILAFSSSSIISSELSPQPNSAWLHIIPKDSIPATVR